MRQILQDMANGHSFIVQAPTPVLAGNSLLIATTVSLISAGTERMLVDFGKASYLNKARQQPEKVKMVLEKMKTDGLVATIEAVQAKLAEPLPLGYCNVGRIVDLGNEVYDFKLNDRVVSNGPHADVVRVTKNLCARIPDEVDDESAAFTVVASIALQGIRLTQPTLGESIVVIGAGLIGLLTIQLLKANGCRVLAIDMDAQKLQLAQQFGAEICQLHLDEDPISAGISFSRGNGADAVIITASTSSNEPVIQAARMSRKRGRIVLVGVTGLGLNRADFYEKELTFQVSCSYGPGRYDPSYENKGIDYPIGFVRWTEQRNFEACLDLMAGGQLDLKPLITHHYLFEEAQQAYKKLTDDKSVLGILLHYTSDVPSRRTKEITLHNNITFKDTKPIVSFIGAGNYASRVLIPAFKIANAQLHSIITPGGTRGVIHGKKLGFPKVTTDIEAILSDKKLNTVVIATRHDTHAPFICKALNAGKHVFVEKPLAIRQEELADIEATYHIVSISAEKKPQLMVGFNRRFSPHIQLMKILLQAVKEPKAFVMTVNAGAIPPSHWTQDHEIGGGRIIGEACHFIDLMRFLAGHKITSIQARRMGDTPWMNVTEDKAAITLGFADGSFGTIHYLANGSTSFPKERIEVFTGGRVLQLNNFRKLRGFGWPKFKKMNLWRQDKGQNQCVAQFLQAIETGTEALIPFDEIIEVATVTIQAADQLRQQTI